MIGIALSTEENLDKLFEMIMDEAKHITNADGRTLYMKTEDAKQLKFEILLNDSMNELLQSPLIHIPIYFYKLVD